MKKFRIYLIVFVSTIFLCFCVETEVYVDYVIINDSSYDIKLDRFYTYGADYLTDSIIERNSFYQLKSSVEEVVFLQLDLLMVVYLLTQLE